VSSRGIIKTIFSLISNDYNISQTVELIAIE
jgi:hypothetical protein